MTFGWFECIVLQESFLLLSLFAGMIWLGLDYNLNKDVNKRGNDHDRRTTTTD